MTWTSRSQAVLGGGVEYWPLAGDPLPRHPSWRIMAGVVARVPSATWLELLPPPLSSLFLGQSAAGSTEPAGGDSKTWHLGGATPWMCRWVLPARPIIRSCLAPRKRTGLCWVSHRECWACVGVTSGWRDPRSLFQILIFLLCVFPWLYQVCLGSDPGRIMKLCLGSHLLFYCICVNCYNIQARWTVLGLTFGLHLEEHLNWEWDYNIVQIRLMICASTVEEKCNEQPRLVKWKCLQGPHK